MIVPLLCAALVAGSAWWAWATVRLRYSPDFELYSQGGLGIYPSPLGRVAGSLGEDVLVGLSILSAALVVLLVWRAAGTSWAAVALTLSPVTLYLGHAGIDPVGLALYTAALAGIRPGLTLTAAALTHWALAPFVLFEVARSKCLSWAQRALLSFFLGGAALIVLIVTPYGGIVAGLLDGGFPLAFLQGLAAGVALAAPALLVFRQRPAHVVALLIGAFECGLQQHLQARYLLPAAVLLVATGELRGWPTRLGDFACKQACRVLQWFRSAGSSGAPDGSSVGEATTQGG